MDSLIRLPIEALELARFASDDADRPNLHWMELALGAMGTSFVVSTTDGHRMARYVWVPEQSERMALGKQPIYILAKPVQKKLNALKRKGDRMHGASLCVEGEWLQFHVGEPLGRITNTATAPSLQFPIVDTVIPNPKLSANWHPGQEKLRGTKIGVNMGYLADVFKWTERCDWRPEVQITVTGPIEPIRIDVANIDGASAGQALFVVMPCRL